MLGHMKPVEGINSLFSKALFNCSCDRKMNFRNQIVKVRRVHTLLLHMNVAHLVVTLIYMPKEIIHNITVAWWGGDLASFIPLFDSDVERTL